MTATAPAEYLDAKSLQAWVDGKGDQLVAVLHATHQPRIGGCVAIAKAIQDVGQLPVVVLPHDAEPSQEELVGFESVPLARISRGAVSQLRGVDLFFSPEGRKDVSPDGAVSVGLFHSLPDVGIKRDRFVWSGAEAIRTVPTIIRSFDYFVLPVRQEEWAEAPYRFIEDVYPAALLRGRRPALDIVPGGYPKLDYSRRVLEGGQGTRCIIYSPTAAGSSVGRVFSDGELVLRTLIREFPDHEIVFRAYPGPFDQRFGRAIADRFDSHRRFVFDDSATGIGYQRECAAVVTDSSSSAVTFAFASGRPLVSVNFGEAADGSKSESGPTRLLLGYSARTASDLVTAVRLSIERAAGWRTVIAEAAEEHLYNPGTAADYLASHLSRFARRESHSEWLSVPRGPWRSPGTERGAARHLDRLERWAGPENRLNPSQQAMYDEIAHYLNLHISRAEQTA